MTRNDRGMMLAELAMVVLLAGVLTALAARFVITIAGETNTATVIANRVDGVRLALDSVERQVRSGDMLYLEAPSGSCSAFGSGSNCLRLATEVDGMTSCVQFQLIPGSAGDGTYELRTRAYSPGWASNGSVGAWRQVTTGLAAPTSASPPFEVAQQSGVGSPALTVQLAAPQASATAAPIRLRATYVPRNALYRSSTTCSGGAPA